MSVAGAAAEAERQTRLAAALRENLRRRKLQKRGRDEISGDRDPDGNDAGRQPLEGKPRVK